ncbi:MAG: protein-glutamate O-methyltransferase CheR [Candidatus Heimdallarchaeota archaeon]|nr:protein-glutamate O-methyltransferase CheR [Candidatus Heimdallarchaeota archaeon]
MSNDDDKYKPRVARGSTLFTSSSGESRKKLREKLANRDKNKPFTPVKVNIKEYPDKKNIDLLIRYLSQNGINPQDYKRNYIERRLRARVARHNLDTYKAYLELLRGDENELKTLKKSLSINVTRFMRNRETYEIIKKDVLPLAIKNAKGKTLNLWSAGCAVGTEPYSMSMLMGDLTTNYSIKATDIKQELLDLARGAMYDEAYLGEVNATERRKYFDQIDNDTYKVKTEYRNKVSFSKLDLLRDTYPKNLDIIFCRNVLIYIDREPQTRIINKFMSSLKDGGFLILGRTESIFKNKDLPNIEVFNGQHRIYRKSTSVTEIAKSQDKSRVIMTEAKPDAKHKEKAKDKSKKKIEDKSKDNKPLAEKIEDRRNQMRKERERRQKEREKSREK